MTHIAMRIILHPSFFLRVLLVILPIFMLSACSTHADEDVIPIDGTDNTTISFDLSSGGEPVTYALGENAEKLVEELDILLFDANGQLAHMPIKGEISVNPSGDAQVKATVPIERYANIILLANSNKMVTAALPSLAIGMLQDDAMKLFKMTHADKWNATSGSAGYLSIPMYGETGYVRVNGSLNNKFSASLVRMLARVDVEVELLGGEKLDLKSVRVYNRATVGMLAPSGVAGETNLPDDLKKVEIPLLYDGGEITTGGTPSVGISSVGEIYLFESTAVSKTDKKTRLADATCLVVGGCYTPEGGTANTSVETFYRIDFAHIGDADSLKYYYDILRNHNYNIRIVSAWGPGEETPEEALNTELSRIEIKILDWEQGGNIGGDMDGQDVLRVAPGGVDLSYSAHTAAPAETDNKMKVSSTHKDGWYISKITELNGAVETETNGWLNTDLAIGVNQSADKVVSLLLTENPDPTPRVGYIYISSGPRMSYKVKVTQLPVLLRIGKVMWEDYDGITVLADGDKGFTSISILDSDGITQTHTPDVPPVGVISQPLKVGADIVKVTVTYKGYVHDIPVANCTFNDLEETLTIDDRTLIGKPIHLDKIRGGDMNGDYIQVADINLSGYTGLNGVAGNWSPIGTDQLRFTGSYDGSTFNIDNFIINRSTDCIGLFGYAEGAILKNIDIVGGNIIGHRYVAAICGTIYSCKIENCTNAAFVSGNEYIGGICGVISLSTITNCKNIEGATITAKAGGNNAGGIIGRSWSSTIENCTNAATVSGADINTSDIGGICGDNDQVNSVIKNCQNVAGAKINGGSDIGGIAGRNSNGTIKDCTNAATVTGTEYVGGIAGGAYGPDTKISGCKNFGRANVDGTGDYVGGIVGSNGKSPSPDTIGGGAISDCTNAATVSGTGTASSYIGGISGYNYMASSSVIRCDNLEGANVEGTGDYIGGIVGHNSGGKTDNCTNVANISGTGTLPTSSYVGGIVGLSGDASSIITNCQNLAESTVKGTGDNVGGIAGTHSGKEDIGACTNAGAVIGVNYVGGLFGSSAAKIGVNCSNKGGVTGANYAGNICGENKGTITGVNNSTAITSTGGFIGGLVGNNKGTIDQCINDAAVTGKDLRVGGIAGNHDDILSKITKCTNTEDGVVNGTGSVGGITGESVSPTGQIQDCENYATITGTASSVGGIIGASSTTTSTWRNKNKGPVNGTNSVGGICGYIHNGGSLKDSYNYATVTGSAGEVGGICGKIADAQSSITNCHNAENAKINGKSGQIGGIAGLNTSATISGCTNKAIVAGEGTVTQVGGIVGSNTGVIFAGSNTGAISGTTGVGGIAGINKDSNGGIFGCSNRGPVEGETNLGGISGSNEDAATIIGSMNSATVTSQDTDAFAGGIVGYNLSGVTRACYNIGLVTTYYGAIVGRGTAPVDCFFGGDADGMGTWEGTRRFGADPDWPEDEGTWSTTATNGYWGNLGGWNDGKPIYPTLRIPPPTP